MGQPQRLIHYNDNALHIDYNYFNMCIANSLFTFARRYMTIITTLILSRDGYAYNTYIPL